MKSLNVSSPLQQIVFFSVSTSNTDSIRHFRFAALFLVILLILPNSSVLGMHPQVEFSEVSHTADVIFVGTVTDVSPWRNPGNRMVFTNVTFEQIDLISRKDHVPEDVEDRITLTFGGGKADGVAMRVSGVPTFEVGQRCLIFTLHDGRRFDNPLVGGEQGLFRLTEDAETGIEYPMATGKAGIVSVNNGRLEKVSRLESIKNGKIQRRAKWNRVIEPPRSKGKSPDGVTAKERSLPDKILSLKEFKKNIHATLAGPKPANPKFRIIDREGIPIEIYPGPGEDLELQDISGQPMSIRSGLIPSVPRFPSSQNNILFPYDKFIGNNVLNPDESSILDTVNKAGDGTYLGWCGHFDLPLVMQQLNSSWSPWYEANNYAMWFFNQFMNVYEYIPSDGRFGDNNENEFCGFISDAKKYRAYGTHWGTALGVCRTWTEWFGIRDCSEIVQADIMFNPIFGWDNTFSNCYKKRSTLYRSVLMHEMGHSWGMQRGNIDETYRYDQLTIMHFYYSDLVEDGYGIHVADAYCIRRAYNDQTAILGIHDMGVESYYADAILKPSTTDKRIYTAGEYMTVQNLVVENMSFLTRQDVELSIYLSHDDKITTSDIKLGDSVTWSTFSGEGTWEGNVTHMIPDSVQPGNYYVGAIVYLEDDDYLLNNATYLNELIEVTCPKPDAPEGVSATDLTYHNRVMVTWDSTEAFTDYEVWRNTSSSIYGNRIAAGIKGESFNDYTTDPETKYYYRVKGRNHCGSVSGFSNYDTGSSALAGDCQAPPLYDYNIIPSIQWQTISGGFLASGCRIYRMYLYPDIGYDLSVCSEDDTGGWFSSEGDGDLAMFDSTGEQVWYIDGFSSCGYDATTIGTAAYSNWSPPTEGYYYLRVNENENMRPAGFNLAYRATSGDECRMPPGYNRTLYPEPYWQVTDSTFMLAGACRTYRIFMSADAKYDFTLCSSDDVGASWTSYTDGDLVLYDSVGEEVLQIDGEAGCRYDASTPGTIYEGLSPPSDDYYYLKVKTHSPNFDATFQLAYKRYTMPAPPQMPVPPNEASNVQQNTNLSWLGILDDFDRPSNHYMGKNWIERSGDFWISINDAMGSKNSLMTFNGAVGEHISVDVHKAASELSYVALVSGYADQENCIFIKIEGSGTEFDEVHFCFGANGNNNSEWSDHRIYTIAEPFTDARISTHLKGEKITLEIDTDFDGDADYAYSRKNIPLNLLGDGIGLGVYGSDSMDNFALVGSAPWASSGSEGDDLALPSFSYDLGHPAIATKVGDLGSSDRGIAVDINQIVEISSLAIKAVIGFKTNLTVKIRELDGTKPGSILASATTTVLAGPLDFYEVPIDFTFQKDHRYDISFNVTGGWGNTGDDQLEFYEFDNPTLDPALGFEVGSFKVLDGRAKSYTDGRLPHIRACFAKPCPTTWDLYFGTEYPPETMIATNLTQPFRDPTPVQTDLLNPCTTYYWRTVKKNCCGQTEGPIWSFTTGDTPPFEPYPENNAVDVPAHSSLLWNNGVATSPVGGSDDPLEILENPGFESGTLSPWYTNGAWSILNQNSHSGNYNAWCNGNYYLHQDLPDIPVEDIYSVTFWGRQRESYKRILLRFYYLDGTNNYVMNETTAAWKMFDITSSLQPDKVLNGIRIWGYSSGGTDEFTYVDDVSIMAKAPPCQTTYNVYFGQTNPPSTLVASGITEPVFDPTPHIGDMLNSCETYYWQIVADNCCGQTRTGSVWSFKTDQIGDIDGTGIVSLTDFAVLAAHWLDIDCIESGWCSGADIDHSTQTDQNDLQLLVEQWLRTCP